MSDQVTVLIICFLNKCSFSKLNYAEILDSSCSFVNNVISLVLRNSRNSDLDSENISLIWHSVSDGQKSCSSKGVSLIGI